MALGPDDWLTLEAAKKHLNMSAASGADDAEVEAFIRRAQSAVSDRIGTVKKPAAALVEFHRGGGPAVRLEQRPVFDVAEITVYGTIVAEADRDTGATGWFIENPRGALLRHDAAFPSGWVKVTYTPGWDPIPPSIEQAGYELLRHMWKTQRGALTGRPGVRGEPIDPAAVSGTGYLLPNRVEQLLHPYTQVPVG